MEDIATDDDLLSDMLLDSLEFEPKISTHKMNQAYRSPRYKTQHIIDIVRQKIVIDSDLAGAVEALCNIDVIKKYLSGKSSRQRYEFTQHAKRYLETYLPESGIEFALTTRYKRASRIHQNPAESSKTAQQIAETEARAEAAAAAAAEALANTSHSSIAKGKLRAENGESLGTTMADLSVVATKPYKAGDLIMLCKGGVKDLTKSEDEALREEAALSRERRKEQQYAGVLGPGRDFSVIRSARKGCSQLLLGPARFVNHDCDPNCEFHRLGQSQMVFRCLRDVGLNEEITTYYGDNYFETGNSECMCLTCEMRGTGIFSSQKKTIEHSEMEVLASQNASNDTQYSGNGDQTKSGPRRSSSRKGKSPPPKAVKVEPTTIQIERNGKLIQKKFSHHVSGREFDPLSTSHVGPQCTCLTCGSSFWAPEAWWLPDECRRCERHFKIYQGDWPGRVPTEPKWSAIYTDRRAKREKVEAERKNKLLDVGSPGLSGTSDIETPVKLSPMRDVEGHDMQPKVSTSKKRPSQSSNNTNGRKKKSKITTETISDNEVEDSIRSLVRPVKQGKGAVKRIVSDDDDDKSGLLDDDEDMSDLTSVSASNDGAMSRTASSSVSVGSSAGSEDRPCGPKMLGKHAKTETLAMFWGAPTGDKRARKQRLNGLESLSDTVKVTNPKHRRTASDVSTTSTWAGQREREFNRSSSGPQARPFQDHQPKAISKHGASVPPTILGGTESAADVKSGSPASLMRKDFIERGEEIYVANSTLDTQDHSNRSTPSSTSLPALATQGPERTSVKNLAMAWGAGVEEGGRGNRKRTTREMGTPVTLMLSSPKHAKDERSATPPSAAMRGQMTGTRRPSLGDMQQQHQPTESVQRYAENASAQGTPLSSSTISASAPPSLPQDSSSNFNGKQPPSPTASDRSVSPGRSISGSPASSAAVRNQSPLAGPHPTIFSARTGVVPGQPIRRNLRWGSGKVSMSRPMVGSASSPLAGPAASSMTTNNQLPSTKLPIVSNPNPMKAISAGNTPLQQHSNEVMSKTSPDPSPTPILADHHKTSFNQSNMPPSSLVKTEPVTHSPTGNIENSSNQAIMTGWKAMIKEDQDGQYENEQTNHQESFANGAQIKMESKSSTIE